MKLVEINGILYTEVVQINAFYLKKNDLVQLLKKVLSFEMSEKKICL